MSRTLFLLSVLLVACGDPVSPSPIDSPGGKGGTSGQGGNAGQEATSGAPGNGGASGEAGHGGTSGQGGAETGGTGGESLAGQGGSGLGGGGGISGGGNGGGGCGQDADCSAGPCLPCSPASYACPKVRCLAGVCEQEAASCDGISCTPMAAAAAGDCGLAQGWSWDGKGCKLLFGCACEGADCGLLKTTKEACLLGRDRCIDPALPCTGRACGAPCSPCPPEVTCEEAPYVCDVLGRCDLGEPSCPTCLNDADCVAPPPPTCPNSAIVTPQAVCEGGACKVMPYECPVFSICDSTFFGGSAVSGCTESFWGFAWYEGACRALWSCDLYIDPDLLYEDWSSCYAPRQACLGAPCQSAADCPEVAPCPTCPDGQEACPSVACVGGSCRYQSKICL